MLKNYIILSFRNIARQKGFSFLNIFGLAIGLACCILIFIYVSNELSYDTYHRDSDRIFRVAKSSQSKSRSDSFASVNLMTGPTLKESFDAVEQYVRFSFERPKPVRYEDRIFMEENFKHADPGIFDIFTIPFVSGNPETALTRPFSVVITEDIARKYFKDENPLGKTLMIDTVGYEITGVIENFPSNTHLKIDIIGSWKSIESDEYMRMGWRSPANVPTYVKLASNVDPAVFEKRIANLIHEYAGEELDRRGAKVSLFLQPLSEIHLHSNLTWELSTPGNVLYVYIFSSIGLLILIIACINFINLSTARVAIRSREVGTRKVIGARRSQVIYQFLVEALVIFGIGTALALILVEISLPHFNALIGINFTVGRLFSLKYAFLLTGFMLSLGIAAGAYPAFILSSANPSYVIKGGIVSGSGGSLLRRLFVGGQFIISIALIIGMLSIQRQIDFMKNKPLGFEKEQKFIIEMPEQAVNEDNYRAIKEEFLQNPSILGATFSSSVPGRWRYLWRTFPFGEEATNTHAINWLQADQDFISEYNLKFAAGTSFSLGENANRLGELIINETAVRTFGWATNDDGLGKSLNRQNNRVKGVLKDYHSHGLQNAIMPLVMYLINDDFRYLSLRLGTDNIGNTVAFIEQKYNEHFPESIFNHFFLDSDFDSQYNSEERLGKLFGVFTILGIVIACLGLFGLAAFSAERRTKEIAVRKVLGATIANIIQLITKEFLLIVMLANIIAWPVAYLAIKGWLQTFPYRSEIGSQIFILSGSIALILAMAIVIFQAVKAAVADPVEALKYE
ncbi:MAG: ABC transporter permease [Candidatus Zixiibacteriota bacterium]|nr:MAG: ABC transporter permease [candidate division Zixibacteria bacterium]